MTTHRLLAALAFVVFAVLTVHAQDLTGRVVDKQSKEALVKATIQLYKISKGTSGRADTVFVSGALTDDHGSFALNEVAAGNYLLKASFIGYESQRLGLGDIALAADAVVLDEAVVTANLPKMVIKDDTVVYNADAYRVPEGSTIEALVEMLPGAKIDDNGGITVNGKNVKRFKMDGRDFMTGNNDAVMKNLPSYTIEKVKAYDEKSDLSKATGIDDGNDDFVLEFVTRRSVRNGLQMNPDLGLGTDDRYGVRLTAMKPFGAMRYTFMGNANNVNDRNFSGRGGRGRGNGNGQRHSKSTALDVSYERSENFKVSGRVTWNHNNTDNWNRTASESFVKTQGGAFSNSVSETLSRANSWTGNMNLQWKIDSLTTLSFRPNFNISTNDSKGTSSSASFNANPYDYVENPLEQADLDYMDENELVLNGRNNKSMRYGNNKNASSQLQIYRRIGTKGRNVALSSNFDLRDESNRNANLSFVRLYQTENQFGTDSTYQTNRYTDSPSNSFRFSVGATYTEPLLVFKPQPVEEEQGPGGGRRGGNRQRTGAQGLFLQLNYRYNYSYQKSDPSTYDFPELSDDAFSQSLNHYREWTRLFGFLDNPYESYLSTRLSRYSERTENGQNIDVQMRLVRNKINMNVGFSTQPQRSHFIQQYLDQPIDTVRRTTNISPTLNLRYRFDQYTNLQVTMRGQTSQPSITQLIDIYDDTNPLNISMGNPALDPSFSTNMNANFQMQRKPTYVEDSLGYQIPKAQRHWSFSTNGGFQMTRNSIGNVVTYNETTGGRISRPENINGNWNMNAGGSFNISLDTLNRWDVSGSIRGNYDHHVAYVNLNRTATPDRNVTHSFNVNPSTSLSFRNSWFSISLNTSLTYAHTENRLQASNNLTTWNYSYGGNTKITFPWGSNLSTDAHVFSKRGYSDNSLNTNEFIWNAQLSHSFLRGKKLTVMLQWYDILREQTTFSRVVNANGWTDREVNAITSYAMLHVTYRLNMFGGGGGRGGGGRMDNSDRPRWSDRPEGGGRPGGYGPPRGDRGF